VLDANPLIVGTYRLRILVVLFGREQVLAYAHSAGGIGHVDRDARVVGAILTAVCTRDVVAPPISSGMEKPSRCISRATWAISSSDGVMRPERPITSAFSWRATSSIFCAGTMTPRLMTS